MNDDFKQLHANKGTEMELFIDRIVMIMDHYSISEEEFVSRTRLNPFLFRSIMTGTVEPTFDFIQKIAVSFKTVNLYWLLLGTGNMK